MITLLPQEAKRAIRREYILRVAGVWALLAAAAAAAGALILVPAYVLLMYETNALALETSTMRDDEQTVLYASARAELEKVQLLARQLDMPAKSPSPSAALGEIRTLQPSEVTLSGFAYVADEPARIEIRGVSATREALVAFTDLLERNPLFARAEVPFSDLAEDRDLPFTVSVSLASVDAPP